MADVASMLIAELANKKKSSALHMTRLYDGANGETILTIYLCSNNMEHVRCIVQEEAGVCRELLSISASAYYGRKDAVRKLISDELEHLLRDPDSFFLSGKKRYDDSFCS